MKYILILSTCIISSISFAALETQQTISHDCPYKLPINKAVCKGDIIFVRSLIEEYGEDCRHAIDYYNRTPLHVAIIENKNEEHIAEYMLTQNIPFAQQDNDGNNALHLTIIHKKSVAFLAKLLALKRMSVNLYNKRQRTPLHEALALYNEDAAKLLVAHGASNMEDEHGIFPLLRTIKSDDQKLFNLLLQLGPIDNMVDKVDRNALHYALLFQDEITINRVIEHAATDAHLEDQRDIDGRTPLHIAMMLSPDAESHAPQLLATIIKRTTRDLNEQDGTGHAPIHTAVLRCCIMGIIALVKAGVPITAPTRDGKTPLELTFDANAGIHEYHDSSSDIYAMMNTMIRECGADANQVIDERGNSILYAAAVAHKPLHMKFLLLNGAARNFRNHAGQTVVEAIEALPHKPHKEYATELKILKTIF